MSESSSRSNFDSKNIRNIEDVFKLLQEGDKLNLGGFKNITLFIGNTSSGKSCVTLLLGDQTIRSVSGSEEGDYIIIDEDKRIDGGIDSVTIFPKEVVDLESNEVFIDCPGFKDTRNSAFDIASTYFIKKVIDDASGVKIILTVNYSSVRTGGDRSDFISLVKHVTEFIKNINKFKNSIALVVTKVDYKYDPSSNPPFVPDNIVINGITKFIKNIQQHLIENNGQKPFYRDAISLLDIIAQDTGRIAILRRPNKEGLVSEIDILQQEKHTIKNMLRHLTFAYKNEDDFGWTITDSSKNSIIAAVDKINLDIKSDIANTVNVVDESYMSIIHRAKHFDTTKETIVELHNQLLLTIQKLERCETHKDFFKEYNCFINSLNVCVSRTFFYSMLNKYNYIKFFQKVSGISINATTLEWSKPLKKSVNLITNNLFWYTFLIELCQKISTYTSHSSFLKILDMMQDINTNNLSSFFTALERCNILGHSQIRNFPIDAGRFIELNTIVNIIRLNTINFSLKSGVLLIKADFIKMSSVVNYLNNSKEHVKSIYILALNSFYIDADLNRKGGMLKLVVISPRWEIFGDRQIILDGIPGASLPPKAAVGHRGKPGLPGGASGCFVGISQRIVNAEHLTISANGGNGGPGQEGGDGEPGIDGRHIYPSGSKEYGERLMKESGYKYLQRKQRFFMGSPRSGLGGKIINTDVYLMYGHKGTNGQNGHEGGVGGIGSSCGTISIHGLGSALVNISRRNGNPGTPGTGGKGGQGGKNADNLECEFEDDDGSWSVKRRESTGRAPSGNDCNETTDQGIIQPEDPATIDNIANIINRYKLYILEHINNAAKNRTLHEFYLQLSYNVFVENSYDSFGYLEELLNIESQFKTLQNQVDVIPYYKTLLTRISHYAERRQPHEQTINHTKFLNYIYTATLSKILTRNNQPDCSLIIDIATHMNAVISNFENYKSSLNEVVNRECSNEYKTQIDMRIKEANDLVVDQISPKIEEFTTYLEQNLETTLKDIIRLKTNAEDNKEALQQKKQILEETMKQKGIMDVVCSLKNIFNTICQFGQNVNNVINIGSQVVKGLGLIDTVSNISSQIPFLETAYEWICKGINYINNNRSNTILAFDHFLDTVLQEICIYGDEYQELIKTVREMKAYISGNESNINVACVISKIKILKQMFERTKKNLKTKSNKTATNMFDSFNKIINLVENFTKTYLVYKNNKEKIKIISDQINWNENQINLLRQHEATLNNNVLPTFMKMKDDVKNVKQHLPSRSRVALKVSKWQIQDSFKELLKSLRKINYDPNLPIELECLVTKIEDAMSLIINIYDQIQCYNEQKELVDYIAGLHSARSNSTNIQNPRMMDAILKLDLVIKSNIVLSQYRKVMSNFRQFSFPLGRYYLEEYDIPTEIQFETNLDDLVANASRRIKDLKLKITENRAQLNRHLDQYVYEDFRNDTNSSASFFSWKGDKYSSIISELMSGREVTLKADIRKSDPNKNAIKFNVVQLKLVSDDAKVLEMLNRKLQSYDVTLQHMGDSCFRIHQKYYVIRSVSQKLMYSFEVNSNGEPVRRNDVYMMLKAGDYMLSPYATWRIQLTQCRNLGFKDLKNFKGKVHLELVGHGKYLRSDCNGLNDISYVYPIEESHSVTDDID